MTRRFLAPALGMLMVACTSGPGPIDDPKHDEDTLQTRIDKDRMFRSSDESPIPKDQRASFQGLSYYDIKAEFRVPAFLTVERSSPPVRMELQTSTNQKRRMMKVGTLGFALGPTALTLTAFVDEDTGSLDRLFVPFGDLTNNVETYGGGRYIELTRTSTGLYDLDFNRAYHPYCVYNTSYDCPVPPRENRLQVSIPSGEKLRPSKRP